MLAPDTVMAGKYVIVGPLDSGGMGDVYDAWQKDLSRPVAIKLLRADILGDETMFRRFRREAEAAASLGHPNIVQVLDFRNDPDEQPMLIMEKLEGRSLRSLLAEEKPLAPQRATFIALQILSALAAAHDANIVHRDVKPANVFILKTFAVRDFVKVLDFGIAKVLEPSGGAVLTELGQVVGTASYMAPEQAKGLQVDCRADLFAVGGILFEALSGQRPRKLGPAALIDAATMPCLKLHAVAPHVDPQLAAVVDRALSLERSARFPSAAAMAAALAPFGPRELTDLDGGEYVQATVRDGASKALERAATVTAPTMDAPTVEDGPLSATLEDGPLAATQDDASYLAATQDDASYLSATRRSAGVSNPQSPSAPPAPRTSYQPPLLLQPPLRAPAGPAGGNPSSRGSAVAAVVIVGLLALGAGAFLFKELRGPSSGGAPSTPRAPTELELIAESRPRRCLLPSTCTGAVSTADEQFAVCTPFLAGQLRAGDLLFVGQPGSAHPRRFVGTVPAGRVRVEAASGVREDVEALEVHGVYCSP